MDRLDQDYGLGLPVLDISIINVSYNHIMKPANTTQDLMIMMNDERPNDRIKKMLID